MADLAPLGGLGDAPAAPVAATSPADLEFRRKLAMALMAQNMNAEPIRSPWQGVAKMLSAAIGGYGAYQAGQEERQGRAAAVKNFADLIQPPPQSGSTSTSAPISIPQNVPVDATTKAVGQIESGGDYSAVGPATKSGDRAYGKYQVMGSNIPGWTSAVTGRAFTPQEFLVNPDVQDAVASSKLGEYQSKYGPEGAARAWFAGEGGMNSPDRKDILGTSVGSYGNKFSKALALALQGQTTPTPGGISAINDAMTPGNNQPSPLDTAQWPSGPVGAPSAMPVTPQQAQQPQMAAPVQRPQANLQKIIAASADPFLPPTYQAIGANLATQSLTPPQFGFQTLPDGTVVRTNPKTGQVEPIYQSSKLEWKQTGQNAFGPTYGLVDLAHQTVNGQPMSQFNQGGIAGANDPSFERITQLRNQGAPYQTMLQQVPLEMREAVDAVINGRSIPSNFGFKSQARPAMMLYAHAIDPTFDESLIPQRTTFAHSMATTTPTSAGGQKILMGTALGHLGEIADAGVALANTQGPIPTAIPGSSYVAHGINRVMNTSTDQAAKVNALDDAVQKFSGEVGKLYSGSQGGGIAEREQTRERFSGSSTPQEMAASLEMSKALIVSKLQALENQRDQVFGPLGASRIQFLDDSGKKAIAKIDNAIAQLRGGQGATQQAPSSVSQSDIEAEMRRRGLLK